MGAYGGQRGMRMQREYERDWRDWFIMAVVGGTVGYVAVKLAQVSVGSLIVCCRTEDSLEDLRWERAADLVQKRVMEEPHLGTELRSSCSRVGSETRLLSQPY